MDFLNKILKHLGKDTNKQFRKQVQEEKKQKYLFSDDLTDKYRSSRTGFFSRKKKAIAPFTNSFTTGVSQIKKRIDDSHMLAYMGLFLLLLSGYIIFFSPYFRVSPSHVLLEASNEGIDVSVAYRAIEDIYGSSLFWLDQEEVAYTLKKSLKNLAHVTIDKLYPNGVKVLMTSAPISYKAKIYGFDREWEMSDNGVLIPKISSVGGSGSLAPALKSLEIISESLRGEVFFDYKQVIADEHMLLVNKIISLFETEWNELTITKIRYFARENEIHMTLTSGTHVLLTLEAETSAQDYASRVNSIKNQLIGLGTYIDKYKAALTDGQMMYIDARIVKKIFICKPKDICQNNLIRIYGDTYK